MAGSISTTRLASSELEPPPPPPDYGPPGTIIIDPCLDFHDTPGHDGHVSDCVPKNYVIKIQCVTYANYVTGPYGTTNIWDRTTYNGKVGFVTDAWVYTGTNGPVTGNC